MNKRLIAPLVIAAATGGCTWLGPDIGRGDMLQLLASAQLPDSAAGTAPVLTIPATGRR